MILQAAVALVALAAMLVTVVARPQRWVEVAVGTAAATAVLVSRAVTVAGARTEVAHLSSVVAFLVVVFVLAQALSALGLFTALGARLGRVGAGSPVRMLRLTFAAGAATTATLSLDATVVLLTPVVSEAARHQGIDPRPHEVACARLANSASLLFPVSNLTNLLAFGATGLSFVGFTVATAPAWLVAVALEYAVVRRWFRARLRAAGHARQQPVPSLPRFPVVLIGVVLAGFVVTSPWRIAPAWIAGVGALVAVAWTLRTGVQRPRDILVAANLPFAWFVLCWAVVVAAVGASVLPSVLDPLVPAGSGLVDLLAVALLATVAANVMNNLPATLLLVPVVAPLGSTALLAMLVGVNLGSNATYVGSLANLLWRRTLELCSTAPRPGDFSGLGLVSTLPLVGAVTVVLWAWTSLIGG